MARSLCHLPRSATLAKEPACCNKAVAPPRRRQYGVNSAASCTSFRSIRRGSAAAAAPPPPSQHLQQKAGTTELYLRRHTAQNDEPQDSLSPICEPGSAMAQSEAAISCKSCSRWGAAAQRAPKTSGICEPKATRTKLGAVSLLPDDYARRGQFPPYDYTPRRGQFPPYDYTPRGQSPPRRLRGWPTVPWMPCLRSVPQKSKTTFGN